MSSTNDCNYVDLFEFNFTTHEEKASKISLMLLIYNQDNESFSLELTTDIIQCNGMIAAYDVMLLDLKVRIPSLIVSSYYVTFSPEIW